jgi:hypothetical protein
MEENMTEEIEKSLPNYNPNRTKGSPAYEAERSALIRARYEGIITPDEYERRMGPLIMSKGRANLPPR